MSKKRMAPASLTQPSLLRSPREEREALPAIEQQIHGAGLPTPSVEYLFAAHLGRMWRFDYAFVPWKIALEVEGGVFGRQVLDGQGQKHFVISSRHASGAGMTEDAHKYNRAAILGWCVIRATPPMVRKGEALEHVLEAFATRGWKRGA